MGSFSGHAIPGTLFLLIGVWHIWCSLVRHVLNPKFYRVRVWNPVPGYNGKLKYLELYVVTIGAFLDMCVELLYSPHFKYYVDGMLNPTHMNDFEHGGMLLMFFVYGVVMLLTEKTSYLPLPDGALCFVGATAFCAEFFLFFFHSTTHKGLEGHYHLILVLLVGLCIFSVIAGALMPNNFAIDLCIGIAMTLQGIWFYQTAFALYGPSMPDGCELKDNNKVVCDSIDHEVRGLLLANFQLYSLVLGVMIAVVSSYGFAVKKYGQATLRSSRGYG